MQATIATESVHTRDMNQSQNHDVQYPTIQQNTSIKETKLMNRLKVIYKKIFQAKVKHGYLMHK